jgi:plastocyanin
VLTGLSFTLAASAAPRTGTLVIRHQLRGCHTWSLNGGAYKVAQHVSLAPGGSLEIVNNDVMPHQVVKASGPAIAVKLVSRGGMMGVPAHGPGMMSHMGATVKVTFPAKGVYRLTTKAGEDYMEMGETIGEDNVLHAIVTVA